MSVIPYQAGLGEQSVARDADDEAELIQRAATDRRAFATLYRRHYRSVSDYVYRRTGDLHATEDLVSDVFLTALRTLPRFRYRGVPLRFWLLRIATNAVNHWSRRRRRRPLHVRLFQIEEPAESAASTEGQTNQQEARGALLALPPKFQTVLALHYFEELSVKDMADVIGCRVGTVKSRLARARDALRRELQQRRLGR